jgi:hypothetical protein
LLIEQAIFTSLRSDRRDGYQLAAHSSGVKTADLRALTIWGPSHDSLLESGADAVSVNFHPLPSGEFCISKTTPGGKEYSGRGQNIYTQCLVVPADVLLRFGNNPFALLTAAFAQGSLRIYDRVPDVLEPFRLAGKAAAVDQALLAQLLTEPGVTWLGAVVEAALSSTSLALVAGQLRLRLVAALINCLPLECRTAFSFSTGLKHSPSRPFRLFCLADDRAERRRLERQYELTVLELGAKPPKQFTATAGWGGFIACAIATGKTAFLEGQLAISRPNLTLADLPKLGDELLEAMAEPETPTGAPAARLHQEPLQFVEVSSTAGTAVPSGVEPAVEPATATAVDPLDDLRRADAPHPRFQRASQVPGPAPADGVAPPDPAQVLGAACPAAIEALERLDDTVFEAIAGKPGALEQLQKLWPEVLAQVGPDLVDESREQYLRHALRVWRDCVDGDQIRNPALATTAIGVVCLLFNE